MGSLSGKSCVACRSGSRLASPPEIASYLAQLTGWQVSTDEGIKRLRKSYRFTNFVQALEFTNKVGALAEQENHHPALQTEWGRVTVTWWTHILGGLHSNDFIMAAKTDELR